METALDHTPTHQHASTHTQNLDTSGLPINSSLLSKDDTAPVLLASCAMAEGSLRLNANLRPAF